MKRLTTAFLLLFSIHSLIFAQSISIEERTATADAVIEGKVIQQESFWDDNHSRIYTRNIVEVSKIFKGNSDLKQIGIITKGGIVGDDFLVVSHTFQTQIDVEGIFFLKNAQKLEKSDFWVRGISNPLIRYKTASQKFIAFDGINKYSNPQNDIYSKIELTTGNILIKKKNNSLESQIDTWLSENFAVKTVDDTDILIEFDFDNVALSGTEHVEFDIMIRTNESGIKFAASDVFIQYSSEAFGNNVVENEKIEASKEDVIENEVYTLQLTDETEQILKFLVNAGLEPNELYPLNAFFEKFIHVKLEVADLWQLASLSFDNFLMENQSLFYDEIRDEYIGFDRISTTDPIFPFMIPDIMSVSPSPVTAGTASYITITGQNFGVQDGSSKVFFKNANWYPGSSLAEWAEVFAANDITNWQNTQITVLVGDLLQGIGSAGTGQVKVENSFGSDISDDILDVRYNIRNLRLSNELSANEYRLQMSRQNHASPNTDFGLTWNVSQNLADRDVLVAPIIGDAIQQWRCGTEIAWNFNDTPVTENTGGTNDQLNLIYNAPSSEFSDPQFAAETFTAGRINECGTVLIFFIRDIDIAIRNTTNYGFAMGNASISLNQKDFYATILHELGHAHMLNHAKPLGKVMYPTILTGSTGERMLTTEDINGGLDVLQSTQDNLTTGNQCPLPMFKRNCLTSTHNHSQEKNNFDFFPNPFSNEINIRFHSGKSQTAQIILINSLGQKVLIKDIKTQQGINQLKLNLSNKFKRGSYIIQVQIGDNSYYSKMIKV